MLSHVAKRMMMHGASLTYSQKIVGMFGANLIGYWPMDEAAGATAEDRSGNNRDGAYTAVTLGQPGIGDGKTCPLFDGAASKMIYTTDAAFKAAFNKDEGAAMCWIKVSAAGDWTDSNWRYYLDIYDTAIRYSMAKSAVNNGLHFDIPTAGSFDELLVGPTANWYHTAITWSVANNQSFFYINGLNLHSLLKPAAFNPALLNQISIGSIGASLFWKGYIAHVQLINRLATPAEVLQSATL